MGDHRASIKIEFEMHGHKKKTDMWINWWPDDWTGVDRRVTEWVKEQADIAMNKWLSKENRREKQAIVETERKEREQLAALKQKYENTPARED